MTIYKRGNKYYCRFQINGERHHYLCSGATSVKEAEKIENGFKYRVQQVQNGLLAKEDKSLRLKRLAEIYLKYARVNNKGYERSRLYVKSILDWFREDKIVQRITVRELEDYRAMLKDKGLKNSSVNRYMGVLSRMFSLGQENKLLKENPCREIRKLKESPHRLRYLTKDEEERLFRELPEGIKPLVICALQTGMRRGEIFNLKWDNVDLERGFIELLETKSGRARKIPISAKLREVLLSRVRVSEYVFPSPYTGRAYTEITESFNKALKRAGIENFRFHDLRHTVATRLVERGIDLVVVKEILGHADISTTMIYAHAVPQRKLEAISILSEY